MRECTQEQYKYFCKMVDDFIAEKSYITEKEEAVLYSVSLIKSESKTPADAKFPPMNMFCVNPYHNGYEVIGFYDSGDDNSKSRTPFTVYAEKKTVWEEFNPAELDLPHKKRRLSPFIPAIIFLIAIITAFVLLNK